MIVIPRGLARSVRALALRCVADRRRGPPPAVVFESRAGTLTVWAGTDDAVLVYSAPARGGDDAVGAPAAAPDAVGGGDDTVEPAADANPRGVARPHPFAADPPGERRRPPDPPADWHPAPPGFLAALHECGRTAAGEPEPGRYALSRVQVRGGAGQVIGTDGRTALVRGGFDLPFADDVLVPAVPVFGARAFAAGPPARLGRTATHLVVAAGPWHVFLPVDPAGRYPDVAAAAPRDAPTAAGIDGRDAAGLLARLPGLPGAGADGRPVTLDLDGGVVVRGRDGATGAVGSVRLERSPATGPPARVVVDRRALARALALGCVTVRAAGGRPVVFEGAGTKLITVALDPALAAGPGPAAVPTPERRRPVRHETNGAGPAGRADPPAADPPDPLAAAEELRAALADAGLKAGRLVAALKARRREQKALTQAWSSLRVLNLGPGGAP